MTSTSIHRLLDEAFAGVAPSPATQDLKEELRTNLLARVEELEAGGMNGDAAARKAFDELGDVRSLVADAAAEDRRGDIGAEWRRHRVRISPGFVVRATLLPIAATAALVVGILAACDVVPGGIGLSAALFAVFAVLIGLVTGDALLQETSHDYAMPAGRAAGYGAGTALVLLGAGGIALCWAGPLWAWLVGGGVLLLGGIGVLAALGATQTNRTKPWAREYSAQWGEAYRDAHLEEWSHPSGDRFSRDPNAAARFGIYTMLIWIVGTITGLLLGFLVGWWWSALGWVAAFIAMMLLLTQMLFQPAKTSDAEPRKGDER